MSVTPRGLPRFTAADADRAYDEWGCNCGPAALAAIAGVDLERARDAIPGFVERGYTSPAMMRAALASLSGWPGWAPLNWPRYGLVRIQWEGPWTEPGVPMVARYRHTHWVGAQQIGDPPAVGVFDVNAIGNGTGWVSLDDWTGEIAPFLAAHIRRANGRWHITHAIEWPTEPPQ